MTKTLTDQQWDEAVTRARAAARDGRSIHSNPYDPDSQVMQWNVWRLAYADATEPDPE